MKYEEMSDFEINKLVVDKHLHMFVNESKSRGRLDSDVWVFDSEGLPRNTNYNPCNKPSDAWPVIVDNGITISPQDNGCEWEASHGLDENLNSKFEEWDINPLRAAMICFLKMKDAEK